MADLAVLCNVTERLQTAVSGKTLGAACPSSSAARTSTWAAGAISGTPPITRRPPPYLLALIETLRDDAVRDVLLVPDRRVLGPRAAERGLVAAAAVRRELGADLAGTQVRLGADQRPQRHGGDRRADLAALACSMPRRRTDQARRMTRVLRGVLRRQRATRIGPDLSHRRTIVARVLRARAVRAVVAAEAREKHDKYRPGLLQARKYAFEIAANYSHAFVQIAEKLLGRVWNRVYDGVKFNHAETLKEVSEGNEVVYVPCHRSHMDYLLLSYVIYHQGYAMPHIAAGINLNIPVVGRFLRKGGAFFIRRSFARQRALHRGVHEVPRGHHGARAFASSTSSKAGARAPAGCCSPRPACCR